ncbi:MAG: PAS domain S-box protein [Candidatus Cloacimonadales bacterium]
MKSSKTILLVEDELMIALSEKMTLNDQGYEVIIVSSGAAAVEKADTMSEIDLILMDINLQGKMQGTEAAEIILARHDLPLIFLSSHTEPEIVQKTEGLTSYGYIVKSSGDLVMLASIKMALQLHASKKAIKKQAQLLRESEEKFRSLIESSNDGICLQTLQGEMIFLNNRKAEMLGYSDKKELLGKNVFSLLPKSEHAKFQILSQTLLQTGSLSNIQTKILKKDSTTFDAEINFKLLSDQAGNPQYIMDTLHDNSRHVKAMKKIEEVMQYQHKLLSFSEDFLSGHQTEIDYCKITQNVLEISKAKYAVLSLYNEDKSFFRTYAISGRNQDVKRVAKILGFDPQKKKWPFDPEIHAKMQQHDFVIYASLSELNLNISTKAVSKIIEKTFQLGDVVVAKISIGSNILGSLLFFMAADEKFSAHEQIEIYVRQVALLLENRQAEKAKEESITSFQNIFDSSNIAIYIQDEEGKFLNLNQAAVDLYGYPKEMLLGKTPKVISAPDKNDLQHVKSCLQKAFNGEPQQFEFWAKNSLGQVFPKLVNVARGSYFGKAVIFAYAIDISSRIEAEDKVKKLLSKKKIILKETHHRVKNNMSIIQSMLNLQAQIQDNLACRHILQDAAARVQSMTTLYDILYRNEKKVSLNLDDFLPALIKDIVKVFDNIIQLETDLQIDSIHLTENILASLGIIFNELITNSLKYAFSGQARGKITVTAKQNGAEITITYADGGNLTDLSDGTGKNSFGTQMIQMLVEQIGGEISLEKSSSAHYLIRFQL